MNQRKQRNRRRAALALVAAAVALVLSGCMRVNMSLTLTEDDTASGSMVMAIQDSVAQSVNMTPDELWEKAESDGTLDQLASLGEVKDYKQDGYTGKEITFSEKSIDELGQSDQFSIVRDGDEYVVSGTLDMSSEFKQVDLDNPAFQQFKSGFQFTIAITFPGVPTSNSGQISGNTVTWNIPLDKPLVLDARGPAGPGSDSDSGNKTDRDSPRQFASPEAVATVDDDSDEGGIPWWVWLIIAVVILAIIGAVLFLVLRRNKSRKAELQAASYGQAPMYQPGQPFPGATDGQGYLQQPGVPTQPHPQQGQPIPPAPGQTPTAPLYPGAQPQQPTQPFAPGQPLPPQQPTQPLPPQDQPTQPFAPDQPLPPQQPTQPLPPQEPDTELQQPVQPPADSPEHPQEPPKQY